MYPHTRRLLEVVAQAVAGLPNRSRCAVTRIRCRSPPAPDRQLATFGRTGQRHAPSLIEAGVAPGRIAEVVGKADAEPLIAADPADPRNRRISVVLLRESKVTAAGGD